MVVLFIYLIFVEEINQLNQKPMNYKVKWEIDLEANSPKEAAQQALDMLQDKGSTATVFKVNGKLIDLDADQDLEP